MVDFIGRGTSTECDLLGHGKEIVDATIQHQTPTSLIGIGAVDLYRFIPNRLDAECRLPKFYKGRFVACFDQTEGMYSKPFTNGNDLGSRGQT